MATKQDILLTPASGYQHIDALLAAGPDWNYLTSNGSDFRTTLHYSFAVDGPQYEAGVQVFNTAQQQAARQVLSYVASVTGISFAEVATSAAADLHFAVAQVANPEFGGICYAGYQYTADATGGLTFYNADAFIYLDSLRTPDPAPAAGGWWYQALLHEIGHALGLKHPFEATADMPTTLQPPYQDTTSFSIMSYTHTSAAYYSQFNEYDLAALNYLYGGDGLRGEWGMGTSGLYLTGSSQDSTVTLPTGRVLFVDAGGRDMVVYAGNRTDYTIAITPDKAWIQVQGEDIDHLISSAVEQLSFSTGAVAVSSLLYPAGQGRPTEEQPGSPLPAGLFACGTNGNDLLIGTAGNDILYDFGGNDTLAGGAGDDLLYGGIGLDTARFDQQLQDAVIVNKGITWTVSSLDGLDTLNGIERLQFQDAVVALDLGPNQAAGMAVLVAHAAGGVASLHDRSFMGALINRFDNGSTVWEVCESLVDSGWFATRTDGTAAGFVQTLYGNVTGATPSAAEQGMLLGMLAGQSDALGQANLLTIAALSQVNHQAVDLVGLQQTGLVFV